MHQGTNRARVLRSARTIRVKVKRRGETDEHDKEDTDHCAGPTCGTFLAEMNRLCHMVTRLVYFP